MIGQLVPATTGQFGEQTAPILFDLAEALELDHSIGELLTEGRAYEAAITESDALDAWGRISLSLRSSGSDFPRSSS